MFFSKTFHSRKCSIHQSMYCDKFRHMNLGMLLCILPHKFACILGSRHDNKFYNIRLRIHSCSPLVRRSWL